MYIHIKHVPTPSSPAPKVHNNLYGQNKYTKHTTQLHLKGNKLSVAYQLYLHLHLHLHMHLHMHLHTHMKPSIAPAAASTPAQLTISGGQRLGTHTRNYVRVGAHRDTPYESRGSRYFVRDCGARYFVRAWYLLENRCT